jgi:hypothetical protein
MPESNNSNPHVVPIVWDPATPACLQLIRLDNNDAGGSIKAVDTLWSHVGAAYFHPFELQALIGIIQAYEEHEKEKNGTKKSSLSLKCRAAVLKCIAAWDAEISTTNEDDSNNLVLLQSMYAVMHLSDVFLPLLQSHLGVDSEFSYTDLYEQPGRATADMVRYLRFKHMPSTLSIEEDFWKASQPEQLDDTYWNCMYALVLRGNLEDACMLLQRHSLYARSLMSVSDDEYLSGTLHEMHEAFEELKELLLRAPLPAGRSDQYDSGIQLRTEEFESTNYYLEDLETQSCDYLFWESSTPYSLPSADVPLAFQPQAAQRQHRIYQDYVRRFRQSFKLTRRIPELNKVLNILQGDLSQCQFNNWAEHLCAELLYKNPLMRPRQIGARARVLMQQYGDLEENEHLELLLNIMDGVAGEAISLMYKLGGSSGAALPATAMTVLFHIYFESGILPTDLSHQHSEFFREAALAIVSSCSKDYGDIGTVLALRLLIPFVLDSGNMEALSLLSELLEHRAPSSDAELKNVVTLCLPLIERKSMQVLEGCISMMIYRFRYCVSNNLVHEGVYWLLYGLELENKHANSHGTCHQQLVAFCFHLTDKLLGGLIQKEACDPIASQHAQDTVEEIQRMEGFDVAKYPEILTLIYSWNIFAALIQDNDLKTAAEYVVLCLDSKLHDGMAVTTIAPISFHWPLLQVAIKIISESVNSFDSQCPFDKHGIDVLRKVLLNLQILALE